MVHETSEAVSRPAVEELDRAFRSCDPAGLSLLGRDQDLSRLGSFLAEVPRFGEALLVLGDPGVGKSALLAAVIGRATVDGFAVLCAVGEPHSAGVRYGPLRQLPNCFDESPSAARELLALLDEQYGTSDVAKALVAGVLSLIVE
jgi:hypothetical protein